MLKRVFKEIEVIKSSSTLNFQSHKNEANDLQSKDTEQTTYYSLEFVNPSLNNSVTPNYCYSKLIFMFL